MCRWNPDPSSSLNGLPMNVASSPSRAAISLTIALKRNARSAESSAAECRRLISNWARPYSCAAAIAPSSYSTAASSIRDSVPLGSATSPTVYTPLS